MAIRVSINEDELNFLELFRVALSPETLEERLAAIRFVRHEVIEGRLQNISECHSRDWINAPENRRLAEWASKTSHDRHEAIYEFTRVSHQYEDRNERRLNIAEHVGKLIDNSIHDGKFEGVQTRNGILYQLTAAGKERGISGARDKDVVRKSWNTYRGIVHLGMAMDLCEDLNMGTGMVLLVAEKIRRRLSEVCPKRTRKPYVDPDEQISFIYESMTYGPRFQNRGLPFYVCTDHFTTVIQHSGKNPKDGKPLRRTSPLYYWLLRTQHHRRPRKAGAMAPQEHGPRLLQAGPQSHLPRRGPERVGGIEPPRSERAAGVELELLRTSDC
ncbi:hypothetical protein [Aliishimia ponticola]|uniref:hypothetical protein n=1 Tax=Aliishimia ponticola TaxID=2499833 RepID=UPI0014561D11|nr:hypothetical protein [Aliishimia ponticola]